MFEGEVVIVSAADPLRVKSHCDTDLKRTMHTNEIITDKVGGLQRKRGATPQLPHSPLLRPWLTDPGIRELKIINLILQGILCVCLVFLLA